MRLKLFRAASMPQAMAQLRAELGPDALIVSTRRVADGVELTAALESPKLIQATPPLPLAAARPPSLPVGSPASGFATQCARALRFHGVPAPLGASLLGASLGQDDLASSLAARLRFGSLPLAGPAPPLLVAGLPGAGKTLSVARLATRFVLAGVAPMIITADGRRAGAAEELASYTRLLGVGLIVANTPATLARALQNRDPAIPALIDTQGVNPFDPAEREIVPALAAVCGAAIVLVAPAGQDPDEAGEQAAAFAQAGAGFLLPTRLDLARRIGSVVASAACGRLVLTEAGTGPGATDGLTALTPALLARLLLAMPALPCPERPEYEETPRHACRG